MVKTCVPPDHTHLCVVRRSEELDEDVQQMFENVIWRPQDYPTTVIIKQARK
jgi:hypothetical protein